MCLPTNLGVLCVISLSAVGCNFAAADDGDEEEDQDGDDDGADDGCSCCDD